MTSQYIITEEQLLDTKSYIYHEDEVAFERIYRKVRSHPYNPQAEQAGDCHYCTKCIETERKSEREKVLDELKQWINKTPASIIQAECEDGDYDVECISKKRIKVKLEELRKGGE